VVFALFRGGMSIHTHARALRAHSKSDGKDFVSLPRSSRVYSGGDEAV
jgi:hypothetical protein